MRALSFFVLFVLCCSAWSQSYQPETPLLSGYVTRAASGSDFDVNGKRILCDGETSIENAKGDGYTPGCFQTVPVVGQGVDVYGHTKKKLHGIYAERIDVKRIHHDDVSGVAVIDAAGAGTSGAVEFRADGYHMRLTPETVAVFDPPLKGAGDVMTNVWVEYEARAGANGVFVLKSAKFSRNMISGREDAMRTQTEYDPAAVPADARPSRTKLALGLGADPQRIPPWHDEAEQRRIEEIGQKLVPEWERNLAATDPSRIDFRFQLTNGNHWPWVYALPSGIILVPHQVVERMENDSELAEVLADAEASALEKQAYRMRAATAVAKSSTLASAAEFIPVVGGPIALVNLGTGTAATIALKKAARQRARVSLTLMHDAGYDVDEAPVAWWRLASKKAKPVEKIGMPEQSEYLYRTLAEEWSAK